VSNASSFRSVAEMFLHRVNSTPDAEALFSPDGDDWKPMLWRELGDRVRAAACGLRALGLNDEDRAAIISGTRAEWIAADLSILCSGGATTTIYPSNTPDECAYIISDSATRYLFAENIEQVRKKILPVREKIPALVNVVVFDGPGGEGGFVLAMSELLAKGKAWDRENPGRYEEIIAAVEPHHLATLVYTSGTTGMPKGVEVTHDAWVFESEAMDKVGVFVPSDRQFLFLPLAHSFGKVLEVAIIRLGIPTAVDGRIEKVVDNLGTFKPTFVAAVPRIFEKVYNKVVSGAREGGALKFGIFKWAVGVGRAAGALRQKGEEPAGLLAVKLKLADKLVFSKIRARFGGRLRFFISGSAPLSREIAEFFYAAGLLILEGYGLTETSAASYVNRPEKFRFGTVGVPLPGVEVKLDPADNEIMLRGRGLMRGYHNLPEATAETLMPDGWLRTGDIGEIDADGFLKITDRKKDLIKTSGGKYVAPQELEGRLKLISPLVSQVVVHGNARNFCSMLITVETEALQKWAAERGIRTSAQALSNAEYAELTRHPDLSAEVQRFIDQLNGGLASYATVKKFAILPSDFSVESGELTPSMKVKRKEIEKRNKALLDSFYEGALADV